MILVKKLFDELAKKYSDCEYSLFWTLYDISREDKDYLVYEYLEDYITEEDELTLGPVNLAYKIEEQDFCYKVIADLLHNTAVFN